jgi:hypothetical protein
VKYLQLTEEENEKKNSVKRTRAASNIFIFTLNYYRNFKHKENKLNRADSIRIYGAPTVEPVSAATL